MRTISTAHLDLFSVFVEVADAKSFRSAARALSVSKSTVSLKVQQLEKYLGIRLLERTTRTVRLSDAGAALHRQVRPAMEALADAERSVKALQTEPVGRVRLAAPVELGQFVLGDILSEYMQRCRAPSSRCGGGERGA